MYIIYFPLSEKKTTVDKLVKKQKNGCSHHAQTTHEVVKAFSVS